MPILKEEVEEEALREGSQMPDHWEEPLADATGII